MAVTRRALLISNPGEDRAPNYCRGVFVDICRYSTFLAEAHGGAWRGDEIDTLNRPTRAQLRAAVARLATYTYSFITFSGHGWYSEKDMCTVLTLRERENIWSSELLAGATKRTVVLDCCRVVHPESIAETRQAFAAKMAHRQANWANCRRLFDHLVSTSTADIVELYACALDEKAGDDEQLGGTYTSSLVTVADRWKSHQEQVVNANPAYQCVATAHDLAADLTTRRRPTQHPKINKPRIAGHYFPFAVFA